MRKTPIAALAGSLTLALAGLMAAPSAQATMVTLDFDGPVDTDITSDFAGLTFRAPLPGTGPVRTWSAPFLADTPNNVLGLSGQPNFYGFNQQTGAIDIVFATPVSDVSIRASFVFADDFHLGVSGLPFMAVYNSDTITAANRLGLIEWDIVGDPCLTGSVCSSAYDTLEFTSASADIKAIRLTGWASAPGFPSRHALFDTLSYGTLGPGPTPVPEPATLTLLGASGLALLLLRRRRRS